MTASTVFCYVLEGNITVVTNINGEITNIVCPHFYRLTHGCNLKNQDSGFIERVLKKMTDQALNTRSIYCEFGDPNNNPLARTMNNG